MINNLIPFLSGIGIGLGISCIIVFIFLIKEMKKLFFDEFKEKNYYNNNLSYNR